MAVTHIDVARLSFSYPGGGHRIDDVSFAVRASEICCLLGPNGAGKTTLLKCLLGLLTPRSGTIRLCGEDSASLSAKALSRCVAYVPQGTSTPFPFTALDIAVMGRSPYLAFHAAPSAEDWDKAAFELARLGIGHLAEHVFSSLSGGEQQLTLLARALVQETPIIVLDEPTAALDFGNEIRFMRIVAELASTGKSVLMTTHQPAHALGFAHHAVLMRAGTIFADGSPADVMTSGNLTELYGVSLHVARVPIPGDAQGEATACVYRTESARRSSSPRQQGHNTT
jgi:iron complex transport system ATP-binding protein